MNLAFRVSVLQDSVWVMSVFSGLSAQVLITALPTCRMFDLGPRVLPSLGIFTSALHPVVAVAVIVLFS